MWAPVATGRQALAAARVQRPDLVLMDIKLRGALDGIETARLMRAEHAVPIVYLTSHSDDATLARAKETQPYGYLLKPFEDRELRTSIEVALHKHHLETELGRRARWFETTLGSLAEAVIATNADAVVSFMNQAAEALTGHARAEAIGRPLGEIEHLVGVSGERLPPPRTSRSRTSTPSSSPARRRWSGATMADGRSRPVPPGSSTTRARSSAPRSCCAT